MAGLVVLEDAMVLRLAQHPSAVEALPALRTARPKRSSCCHGPRPDFAALKAAIASLPSERLAVVKSALGCSSIRVIYHDGPRIVDKTI
jgi:hypothetical protein